MITPKLSEKENKLGRTPIEEPSARLTKYDGTTFNTVDMTYTKNRTQSKHKTINSQRQTTTHTCKTEQLNLNFRLL